MRSIVARTLRDPNGDVFSVDAVNDFITEGMLSLSGYRPIETTEAFDYDPATSSLGTVFPLGVLTYVWQVAVSSPDDYIVLPYNGDMGGSGGQVGSGWEVWAGVLRISRFASFNLDAWLSQTGTLTIGAWGYRDRVVPDSDDDNLDLQDATDQLCLTRECRALGFQALSNDRALYQQWLAATNNTDVSPTQLSGMLNGAISDVEKQRKRNAIIRRVPIAGF
jgi:hypothetical protein